jgi:hypothetical protein
MIWEECLFLCWRGTSHWSMVSPHNTQMSTEVLLPHSVRPKTAAPRSFRPYLRLRQLAVAIAAETAWERRD